MTALRNRLTVLAAATVGITVVLVAITAYAALRHELRGQVDDALTARYLQVQRNADRLAGRPSFDFRFPAPSASQGVPAGTVKILAPDGTIIATEPSDIDVPVDRVDALVARGARRIVARDLDAGGVHVRVLTVAYRDGGAFQIAQSLANVDETLGRLRTVLIFLCVAATFLAAAFGRLFGRQVIQPVTELTQAAEHITRTEDLGRRIEVRSNDEVGEMAARFNAMLDKLEGSRRALDDSVHAQRQLVADASHELRTPVTSLRTNIEVLLAGGGDLAPDDRRQLLEDVRAETEELTALITDVIEVARGDEPLAAVDEVQLDAIVTEALARARRRRPAATFEAQLEPTVVMGVPERLGRAVDNLLDNAAKYSPDGSVVEVGLHDGELTVRDHGPGIPEADRPHVFDRFYRGTKARGQPGSGLGLAIVRQVAETHGGTIAVEAGATGGALFRMRLPVLDAAAPARHQPRS